MTVDESKAKADFDQLTKTLKITIAVKQPQQPFHPRTELKRSSTSEQIHPEKEGALTPPSFDHQEKTEMDGVLPDGGSDDFIKQAALIEETSLEEEAETSGLTPNEKKWQEIHKTIHSQNFSSNKARILQSQESKNVQQDDERLDTIPSNFDLDLIMSLD